MTEYWNQAVSFFTDQGVSQWVAITYIIVSALLVVMALVALVMRVYVIIKYYEGTRTKAKSGKTSFEIAREALDKAGMTDVKVKKAGWLRAFFIGNSYSTSAKTIYLRRNIANKSTITAVSMALQKVAIAKMDKEGNGSIKVRNGAQVLSLVGPILFVPVVLLGFILDFVLFHIFGLFSILGIVVGFVIVGAGFVATLLNLPVEKKANEIALQLIDETGVLTAEERAIAKKVFDAYIVAYICEFIVAILRIVQIVLEIIMNAQINNKSNN